MSGLLVDTIGRDASIPANTLVILFDIAFVSRPGPGGYAAIIAEGEEAEIKVLRGALPEATTSALLAEALAKLAPEIGRKRALFVVRTPEIADLLTNRLKDFKLLRVLGNSPLAVCEATRHASVIAERTWHTRKAIAETFRVTAEIDQLDENALKDLGPIRVALGVAAEAITPEKLDQPKVAAKAQALLDQAQATRLFSLGNRIREMLRFNFSSQGKS